MPPNNNVDAENSDKPLEVRASDKPEMMNIFAKIWVSTCFKQKIGYPSPSNA